MTNDNDFRGQLRHSLIKEAERYEANGEPLPATLYSQLLLAGIDASLYRHCGVQEEIDFDINDYIDDIENEDYTDEMIRDDELNTNSLN